VLDYAWVLMCVGVVGYLLAFMFVTFLAFERCKEIFVGLFIHVSCIRFFFTGF